jgi:hypothetical protein
MYVHWPRADDINLRYNIQKSIGEAYMVRHVIVWTLKDELSESEKEAVKAGIKEGLEGLHGKIPGMIEISVNCDKLASSSGDAMLDSLFEDADSLKAYSSNPLHVAVADSKVRPFVKIRSSFDYIVSE